MRHKRFWLAIVSALIATQHNTSEAAAQMPDTDRDHSVRVQASTTEEKAVVTLFDQSSYSQVLEIASATWPRLEAMPDRVLYCVAESYIRSGQVKLAKKGFELLFTRAPQNHNFRAGLAYTLLYAGEMDRGLAMYKQVLLENQTMLAAAAEDAVALLSQGNISGGKALFQMVISISPAKQHYIQWYERSLRMYGLADDIPVPRSIEVTADEQPATIVKSDRKLLQAEAVEMAKNGKYQQSLNIMSRLLYEDCQDKSIVSDYIDILQKADLNRQAINLYEQQASTDMPFYAIRSVSTAYFRLSEYDKALTVMQPAITRGERDALLWAGEMHMLRGDNVGANVFYERLLAGNPNDFGVYFSRGMLSLQIGDCRQAARDLERARILVPDGPEKSIRLGQVEHDLAVAYINLGQHEKAASILVKYTKTLPVDSLIAGDYISARSSSGQHELAVRESGRIWPTYTEASLLGLKSLAESYIQLGKQEQAIKVYQSIAERQSSGDVSSRVLAFQLMLNGHLAEGLGYYERLLEKSVNADSAVADGVVLLNTEKYTAGKMLFELVLSKYPNQAYYKQYAEALTKKNLNQAAYQQYQKLSTQPEGELAGFSGMVRTALAFGDYGKFRQALDTISSKYGRSKAVAAIEYSYKDRKPGSVEKNYVFANNNRGTEFRTANIAASPENRAYVSNTGELNSNQTAVLKTISEFEKVSNTGSDPKVIDGPGYIAPETYNGLIDGLMQIGKGVNHKDNRTKINGEIRYHYAFNNGPDQWGKDSSGFRTYLGADTRINKDWYAYGMLESEKDILNYNNYLKLSRLYVAGKVGESTVSAGSFGYLMAEGNIYDSGFKGVSVNVGKPVNYTLSYGETDYTKKMYIATARFNDFDYNLEAGIYRYQMDGSVNNHNTIWNLAGNYKFSNFSVGAMCLGSTLKDSSGGRNGHVFSLSYGDLREYRPGTYSIFAKYYDQTKGTYIAHGMNGRGGSMQGMKGYGSGMKYTLAKDLVAGIEYYDLKDKVTGEKSKTMWVQVTNYF